MKEVFISYKSEEFEEASWVKSVLENNGVSCWMAPDSIPGGSSYAVEIPKAIRECKVFVLILSEKSQTSQWVSREVDRAINEGKIVLPFMLENCELKDDFNFYLTNVQRYSAYENKMKAMEKMYEEIKAILGVNVEQNKENEKIKEDVETTKVEPVVNIQSEDATSKITIEKPAVVTPVKQKDTKKTKTTKSKASRFLPIIIFAVIIAVIVAFKVITNLVNTVEFAGEKFKKDVLSITLNDKTLTEEDMSTLGKFNNLAYTRFTNCTFPSTDINIIFEKTRHTVMLDNCGITNEHLNSVDFEGLNEEFDTLNLDNNPELTDISMVFNEGYTLEVITVKNCGIKDISCFGSAYNFDCLKNFEADNNGISDISALSGHKQLEYLSLANNNIDSVKTLSEMQNLKHLDISSNKLTNLEGLENLIFLETLNVENNKISVLDPLSNCTQLTDVNLGKNNISDISVLSKSVEKLSVVNVNDNDISNLLSFSGASKLKKLSVDNNALTSLEGLENCIALTELSAANNQIDNIAGIVNCNFTKVNLANNKLVSTEGISFTNDSYVAVLNVSNNQITNFSFKLDGEGNIKFKEIVVYGNDISDFSCLKGISGSKLVFKYNESIDFSTWSNYDFYEYYVIDCPLDKQVQLAEILGSYNTKFVTEKEFLELNES